MDNETTAATPDVETAAETPEPVGPPAVLPPVDRDLAAALLGRFLGQQGSVARGTIAECNDDECRAILAAADDRTTARQQIKDVLTRAYDRRRDAAAEEATAEANSRRRSSLAGDVLKRALSASDQLAFDAVGKLTQEEIEQLARLAEVPDCHDQAQAVLDNAEKRLAAAAAEKRLAAEQKETKETK